MAWHKPWTWFRKPEAAPAVPAEPEPVEVQSVPLELVEAVLTELAEGQRGLANDPAHDSPHFKDKRNECANALEEALREIQRRAAEIE